VPRADPAAKRLCISGTKVLLPRFTPPKLTIAVGPAKLVETLGFCWGFETGHTHGKSAAVVRRELFFDWMDRQLEDMISGFDYLRIERRCCVICVSKGPRRADHDDVASLRF
jgi:hypothetical protein